MIRFKNKNKKNKKIFRIPLVIQNNNLKPPISLNFEKRIIIEGDEFYKVCRDMNNVVDFV